jgi:simple sugar transport system substrate-binding protein
MKKVLLWMVVVAVAISLASVLSLGSCKAEEAAPAEEAAEEEAMEKDMSDFDIVFIVKVDGIAWFDTERAGLDQCAADYGFGSATTIGPPTADAALQAQMIEDQIAAGVEAIGIVPNDPAAVEPVLKKAMDLGIITYAHEGSAMENINFDIEAMSNQVFGETIFERGISDSGDTGQYVWSVGWLTSTSHNEWVDAGIALQQEKYPDKVNALGYAAGSDRFEEQEDTTIAHDKILEFFDTYPELNQIFGSPMTTMVAAGLAIEEKGLKDKVFACGTGLPITIGDHLRNGVVQEGFFWDPWGVGYALGYAAMMEYLGTPMKPGDPVLRPDGTELKRYESIDRIQNAAGSDVIFGTGLERVNLDNLEEWDEIFKGYGF